MKHISDNINSVLLLQISQQQRLFQVRQNQLYELVASLHDSSNIDTLATLPMLEADIAKLGALHGRINRSVQAVNRNTPPASNC